MELNPKSVKIDNLTNKNSTPYSHKGAAGATNQSSRVVPIKFYAPLPWFSIHSVTTQRKKTAVLPIANGQNTGIKEQKIKEKFPNQFEVNSVIQKNRL